MTGHILRDEAIKIEMDRQSTKNQVTSYLNHMTIWKQNGYEFTEEQLRQLIKLWQVTKGGDDAAVGLVE